MHRREFLKWIGAIPFILNTQFFEKITINCNDLVAQLQGSIEFQLEFPMAFETQEIIVSRNEHKLFMPMVAR